MELTTDDDDKEEINQDVISAEELEGVSDDYKESEDSDSNNDMEAIQNLPEEVVSEGDNSYHAETEKEFPVDDHPGFSMC